MPVGWRARLIKLGGWPRRIAALFCLALALLSTVSARGTQTPNRLAPGAGQVAVRVVLADGGAGARFLRPGDQVDLLAGAPTDTAAVAGPTTRIEHVLVLDVRPPPATTLGSDDHQDGTVLIVAVGADAVAAVTALVARQVLAARDKAS